MFERAVRHGLRFLPAVASLVVVTLLGTGCATVPRADSQARPGTQFSNYRTFAVLPIGSSPVGDPGMALRLEEVAVASVERAMWAIGLETRPLEEAQLAVALRIQSVPKVEVLDWGYTPYHSPWGGYGYSYGFRSVDVRTYEQRTLVIELFDHHSKEMIWTGWSNLSGRGKVKAEDLQRTIARILAGFPPSSD